MKLDRELSKEEIEKFTRKDRRIARYLDIVKRKEMLKLVLGKKERLN